MSDRGRCNICSGLPKRSFILSEVYLRSFLTPGLGSVEYLLPSLTLVAPTPHFAFSGDRGCRRTGRDSVDSDTRR